MNIPENILQAVADAAFDQSPSSPLSCVPSGTNWKRQPNIRRAIIQHAITNPALAPFLAGKAIARAEAELGILRSISEMPETVPEGCIVVTGGKDYDGDWTLGDYAEKLDTHFAILRLPAAEATPPADPAAQVPLGPEDCPPGSTLRAAQGHWFIVLHVEATGVMISNVNGSRFIEWHELKDEGWQINISRPDTGRWDENAWRACSKPAGKEVAK